MTIAKRLKILLGVPLVILMGLGFLVEAWRRSGNSSSKELVQECHLSVE
jgi:hypothetical protein